VRRPAVDTRQLKSHVSPALIVQLPYPFPYCLPNPSLRSSRQVPLEERFLTLATSLTPSLTPQFDTCNDKVIPRFLFCSLAFFFSSLSRLQKNILRMIASCGNLVDLFSSYYLEARLLFYLIHFFLFTFAFSFVGHIFGAIALFSVS